MKKFFNFLIYDTFGRLFALMILSGIFLVSGEKLDNIILYSIGAIFACIAFAATIYILVVSNIGNKDK